jgi:hypothetical protein
MAAAIGNQILYLSASKPTTDSTTSGGAIDKLKRVLLTQLTANAVIGAKSSSASDTTQTLSIVGRDVNGVLLAPVTVTLNGTVEVDTAQSFSMIESVLLSAVTVGTVSVLQGVGGAVVQTIPVGELGFAVMFQGAEGQASPVARFEKCFMFDSDVAGLTAPVAIIPIDSTGYYAIGVTLAQNDAVSVVNRLTAPAGIQFLPDNASAPGPNIASGSQWGIWIKQSLPASPPTALPQFTLQVQYS